MLERVERCERADGHVAGFAEMGARIQRRHAVRADHHVAFVARLIVTGMRRHRRAHLDPLPRRRPATSLMHSTRKGHARGFTDLYPKTSILSKYRQRRTNPHPDLPALAQVPGIHSRILMWI